MKWTEEFDLFLFDLDGLLVNTENIHYQAYLDMLRRRGFNLDWTFLKFCEVAHFDDNSLKDGVYSIFPDLYEQEPNWEILTAEKNRIYMDVINSAKVELLPGVKKLLEFLDVKNKKRCVVTNSSKPMADIIIAKQPFLKIIPHWITREDYLLPKPNPDGYIRAITLYGEEGDKIIGFEDSLRGIRALQQTPAKSVLIGPLQDPRIDAILTKEDLHFSSFEDIPQKL